MAISNALELLVQASPRELHHKQADGTRVVDRLYEACCTSGLVPPQPAAASSTKGAVEHRYCAIFDAALNNGLGCWLIDYVELVVADKHLSSSDSVDAYLLDGEFVKAWCSQHLDQAEATLSQALASDASLAQFAAAAAAQLSRVNALVRILQALQQLRKRDASMAQAGPIAGRLARSSERSVVNFWS